MAQVNRGLVRVEEGGGNTTVWHVWELDLVTLVGAAPVFSPGDAVTWPGSGAGEVTSWDASAQRLRLYRTGGTTGPAEGETITNTTQAGKSGVVDARGADSPPGWVAALTGQATKEFSAGAGSIYSVSATFGEDSLELTAPWLDGTVPETNYGIQIDWTDPVPLALLEIGDVDALAFLSRSMSEVNRRLTYRGASLGLDVSQLALLRGSGVFNRVKWDRTDYDVGGGAGWVQNDLVNGDFFTVPSGVSRVQCYGGVTASVTGQTYLGIRVLINGAAAYVGYQLPRTPLDRLFLVTAPLSVVAGDDLTMETTVVGGAGTYSIVANAQQHFAVRAIELT